MTAADANDVLAIYAYGLSTRNATFEICCPEWAEWDRKHHKR